MHVGVALPKLAAKSSVCCLLNQPWNHKPKASFGHLGVSEKCNLSRKGDEIMWRAGALQVENAPSFSVGQKFQLDDVIEAQQFDRETLSAIFEVARSMESIESSSSRSQMLKGYLMATLFYEPSTRTRLSFESAMKRLGGDVLTTENAREFSSAAKGETLEGMSFQLTMQCFFGWCISLLFCLKLEFYTTLLLADTIRTVEGYSDIIVMRHFESGAAKRAAATASIPVINAGDGPGQHPTQVLRICHY